MMETSVPDNLGSRRKYVRMAVILAIVAGISILVEHYGQGHLSGFMDWVRRQGKWAPAFFIITNAIGLMLLIPQVLFTIVAGMVFGALWGTVWSSAAMTLGAVLAFGLSRFALRNHIRRRWGRSGLFARLERLSHSHPLHVIAVTRLLPAMPFPVVNYLLGVTNVKFTPFVILTWLCMLPETILLTTGGHILREGVIRGSAPWELLIILAGASIILFAVIRVVRKRYSR